MAIPDLGQILEPDVIMLPIQQVFTHRYFMSAMTCRWEEASQMRAACQVKQN